MTTGRFEDLKTLQEHIWTYAERGVRLTANAMAMPAFATAGPAGPAVRTVAPRRIDVSERVIDFHTDSRSPKLEHLKAGTRACWMAWDEELGQQFQYFGAASVHFDDQVADSLWAEQPIDNLEFYFKKVAPGTSVEGPESAIDINAVDEESARANFCVVRTTVDEMIWLHLHEEGEYRVRYQWRDGQFWGEWIVP